MSDIGIVVSLDDQSVEQGKVVLDYTNRDFAAIRTQLIGLAKGFMPDWQTAGETSDFGTLILELFAYMGDVLHFYIDRTASEAFLGTAVRRQSILYIADMMGYTPIGQQAATVQLNVTLQADDVAHPGTVVPVTLPAGTKFYNSAGNADSVVVFELDGQITLNPGDTLVTYATEGLTVGAKSLGLCSGVPNTEFVITDKGVIFGSVQVQTREGAQIVSWTTTQHLATARPTQAVFTTFMDESGYTHIVFGDNSSGRIPPVNAEVFVNYRFGIGAAANDLAAFDVDTIGAVPDIDMYGLSVTNPSSPVGGSDPEDIDAMRFTISRGGARIRDRAVTLMDFADLAMQVPGVTKSIAYGTVYTAVHVIVAPPNGQADDAYMVRLTNAVEAYLSDKVMVGSSVYIHPQHVEDLWQDVFVRILVHVQDVYNRTTVRLQVDSVVRSLLSFTSVDFGYRVSIGMLYRAVLAVQGVEFAEVQWLSTEPPPNEQAFPWRATADPAAPSAGTVTDLLGSSGWDYDTSVIMAAPGSGRVRLNSATVPTAIAIANIDKLTTDQSAWLATLKVGDHIVFTQALNKAQWFSMIVTGAVVANAGWKQVPVAVVSQAPFLPETNHEATIDFIRYAPNPTTPTGDVNDINTPELLIPRIFPPSDPVLIEDEVDFPGLTEAERTHDGLWVKAIGGIPNS